MQTYMHELETEREREREREREINNKLKMPMYSYKSQIVVYLQYYETQENHTHFENNLAFSFRVTSLENGYRRTAENDNEHCSRTDVAVHNNI